MNRTELRLRVLEEVEAGYWAYHPPWKSSERGEWRTWRFGDVHLRKAEVGETNALNLAKLEGLVGNKLGARVLAPRQAYLTADGVKLLVEWRGQ